jgi:hypothetical protein
MEHILLAIDGTKTDVNTVDFACYIARITHSRLKAVFMGDMKENEIPVQKLLFALPYVETIIAHDLPGEDEMKRSLENNEKLFGEACVNRGVNYSLYRNMKGSAAEIIKESRFSDLIIMNPETSIENGDEGSPSRFVKEILAGSECPVILAPYSFDNISEIIFAYDGSKSSVFAIKQFIHLFPGFNTKTITILRVEEESGQTPSETDKVAELITSHYADVKFVHLVGNPGNELFNYLLGMKNIFVVTGAYGRNMISSLFRQSTAELMLETINLPFFIAHV